MTLPATLPSNAGRSKPVINTQVDRRYWRLAAAISWSKVASRPSLTICRSGFASNQLRIWRAPSANGTVQMNSGTNALTLLLSKTTEWDLSPRSEGPSSGAAAGPHRLRHHRSRGTGARTFASGGQVPFGVLRQQQSQGVGPRIHLHGSVRTRRTPDPQLVRRESGSADSRRGSQRHLRPTDRSRKTPISVGPPSQEALGEARGTLGFRLPSPPPPSLAQRMTVKDAVWVVGSRPAV